MPIPPFPTLTTRRLALRALRPADSARVEVLVGDARVSRWLLAVPYPYPPGAAHAWIVRSHAEWADGSGATFAITARGTLVGAIGVRVNHKHAHAELGYWLGTAYWGRGLAAEAGRAVVPWAFRQFRLRRIFAQYLGDNHASGRVLEKIGLLREGVRRKHYKKGRRWYDAHQFGILREELEPEER